MRADVFNIAGAIAFAGFVLGALWASRATAGTGSGRRRVSLLLVYACAASFGVGLTQRDLWPFSSWPLVAGRIGPFVTHPRLVAVDAAGAEHDVDYRAWEPISLDELNAWVEQELMRLPPSGRDSALAHLLRLAESGRARAAAGGSPGDQARLLGPLTAPLFLLHPRRWDDPAEVPRASFVALRYYRESWQLERRARDRSAVTRRLAWQFPAP